ncbi:MAG: geranylgeranylglyceryl/heptaprenylglyceryl phosphate synthase [Candidatus Hodarchaeota archaeon]
MIHTFVSEKKINWRCNKISKLAILIDPNKGEATERMLQALQMMLTENEDPSSLPIEIWVGDSKEMFRGVHRVLKRLHTFEIDLPSVVIFPGHPLQISPLADYIQMPTLLNTYRFSIKVLVKLGKKYHWISKWARRLVGKHWPFDRKYGYMVLSPYSTVGKKIRAKELSDKEAYEEITDKWRKYWWGLYIEAGSGNFSASVAGRLELVERVAHFVHDKGAILLTGGGIRTKEQVADLAKAGSDIIVVSSVLEKTENPKELMTQFLEAVQVTPMISV